METKENGTALAKRSSTTVAKQNVTGNELATTGETAATAAAAHNEAMVRARYTMAMMRPRDLDVVREKALKECRRPRFAEVARYSKPLGKKKNEATGEMEPAFAVGWSIRAAEALARIVGNIDVQTHVIADDSRQRLVSVTAIDMESNVSTTVEVMVTKTVERKFLKKGQTAISSRLNSYGDIVHLIEATDDEAAVKQAALVAKARRNAILQLVPGDILDEMLEIVEETIEKEDQRDPDANRKRAFDAFATLGIKAAQLVEYVKLRFDKPADALIGAEIKELSAIYAGLRDGDTTWAEVMSGVLPDADVVGETKASAAAPPKTTADLKRAEREKQAAKNGATPAMGEPGGAEPPVSGDK